jgi:stage II sporulation protein D
LSGTFQLAANLSRIIPWTIRRGRYLQISKGKMVALLLLLAILTGCKERKLTLPTPQMDINPQFWIRILLLNNVGECTLKTGSPCSISDSQPQITEKRIERIDVPIEIKLIEGKIAVADETFTGDNIVIRPDSPYIFNLNGDDYRGKLKLIVNPDGNSLDVINIIPPEPYLAGVVGAEMPDYWEPEALKAQAIAARTYCFYTKNQFGVNRTYDMKKTAANQVYRGLSAESAQVWDAVNQTKGQVLICKQNDGTEDIFPAYYSSTCGGHTENSENVFGDSFEPLIGVPCPYCRNVAKPKFFFWPVILYDAADVTSKLFQRYPQLKTLGKITTITVAGQIDHGEFSRLTKIKLIGSSGKSDFLRAEDFRLTIDPTGQKIKSTACQIVKWRDKWAFLSGRGWGHGVGMCQCGAQGMARKGKNSMQILSYYYPNSKLSTIDY